MSGPGSFFDPFVDSDSLFVKKPGGGLLLEDRNNNWKLIRGPLREPQEKSPKKTELVVLGRGTVAVSSDAADRLLFTIRTATLGAPDLFLQIGIKECTMFYRTGQNTVTIPTTFLKNPEACYLRPGVQTTYWFSIDNPNGILSYGKYYTNKSLTLMQATLKKKTEQGTMIWVSQEEYGWLDSLKGVEVTQDKGSEDPSKIKILALPVVMDLSPYVMSDQNISLLDLERGIYTTPANLPPACQVLYGNVAGPKIVLDTPDFPDFSKAIQRSVTTEGLIGYKLLKAKSGEFGHEDFLGTYLRITLGYNLGDSPGIPYVLEIWPAGHYSPIHDHGDANAVIKVLHGEIDATFFDSLTPPGPNMIGNTAKLQKDMITWIGPQNYQVHQLYNVSEDVCCTIQCYRYDDTDNVHYDKFRYVEDGKEKDFIPNSDMAYSDFYQAIKAEWEARDQKNYEWRLVKSSNKN